MSSVVVAIAFTIVCVLVFLFRDANLCVGCVAPSLVAVARSINIFNLLFRTIYQCEFTRERSA